MQNKPVCTLYAGGGGSAGRTPAPTSGTRAPYRMTGKETSRVILAKRMSERQLAPWRAQKSMRASMVQGGCNVHMTHGLDLTLASLMRPCLLRKTAFVVRNTTGAAVSALCPGASYEITVGGAALHCIVSASCIAAAPCSYQTASCSDPCGIIS